MALLFAAGWLTRLLGLALFLCSVFMILLILVQRGRGGGLAGAFGGLGGQSAFGTKAGDTFTRVTAVTAVIWMLLCIGTGFSVKSGNKFKTGAPPDNTATESQSDGGTTNNMPAPVSTPAGDTGSTPAAPAGTTNP